MSEHLAADHVSSDRRPRANGSATLLVFAAIACSACSGVFAKGDGRAIGDDIGRFGIDAKLEDSTCGPGALGSTDDFRFEVFFSEAPPRVYWNTGSDSVEGDLDDDGVHFQFLSTTVVTIPGDQPAATTCTIVRTDTSSGVFDDARKARSLTGSLEYRYAAEGRSDCSSATVTDGLDTLPCRMQYSIAGAWVSAR